MAAIPEDREDGFGGTATTLIESLDRSIDLKSGSRFLQRVLELASPTIALGTNRINILFVSPFNTRTVGSRRAISDATATTISTSPNVAGSVAVSPKSIVLSRR